jgi:hypothetical protein
MPSVLAQDRQIQGIVFDSATKQRITRVYIYDTRNNKGIYNNTKGEFTLTARQGDTLIVALQGYGIDTVTVQQQSTYIFYLMPTSILLQEVVINDSALTPDKQLAEVKKEYKDIYRIGSTKDILSVGSTGAGLGIDALYNLLSKKGNNARHLQEIIESDYKDAIINYRFTKTLVSNATGLNGERLTDFMRQYRPDYYFVLEATDYDFVSFIMTNYARYMQDPTAYRLPPLK